MSAANYDKYAPALYGVLLKVIPDNAVASDLLEKVFIEHACTEGSGFPTFIQLYRCMIKQLLERHLIHPRDVRCLFSAEQTCA
jgi:hypothetical protein